MSRKWGVLGSLLALLIVPWMRLPGITRGRTGKTFRCTLSGDSNSTLIITSNTSGLEWLSVNLNGIKMQEWMYIGYNRWIPCEDTAIGSRVTVEKTFLGRCTMELRSSEVAHLLCYAQGFYAIICGHVEEDHFNRLWQINVEGRGDGLWEICE